MSYCRFSYESEVYVCVTYSEGRIMWACRACELIPEGDDGLLVVLAESAEDMADHLEVHVGAGHLVPPHVIPLLRAEPPDEWIDK